MFKAKFQEFVEYLKRKPALMIVFVVSAFFAGGIAALLVDIHGKMTEGRYYPMMYFKVTDDDVNPEVWGKNFPGQYRTFLEMKDADEYTQFGGSLPYSKLIRNPQLTVLWAGYPFSADFNEERSHYYAQIDQLNTKRVDKAWLNANGFPKFKGQPATCMNCHSGWAPRLIREYGWLDFNSTPYIDMAEKLKQKYGTGDFQAGLGGTCADCHSPQDMSLRVTRIAYINAMVKRGYAADPKTGIKGNRREMRKHVCQQCHVEYYFAPKTNELVFPWHFWKKDAPLKIENIDEYYDVIAKAENPFKADWIHKLTGAPMIKIQHPEAELFSSGIHARAGVGCADCHMGYVREGSYKITNHKIQSPLFQINRTCMTCHPIDEIQIRERVLHIQKATAQAMRLAEGAILALIEDIVKAKRLILAKYNIAETAPVEEQEKVIARPLEKARMLHRKASLRWDFIYSENSTGFHSPQEAMRVLAQAIDYARKGQLEVQLALKNLNLSLDPVAGYGTIPPTPKPIPGRKEGMVPPVELLKIDREL